MTRRGRELQEQVSDNFGDWADNLVRTNHRVQDTLSQVQALLDRFNRSLQQAS